MGSRIIGAGVMLVSHADGGDRRTGTARSIGEAVRNVRLAARLRQEDFAARVGVSRETVSAWEQGRTSPTHGQRTLTVARLADAPRAALMSLVAAFGVAGRRPVSGQNGGPTDTEADEARPGRGPRGGRRALDVPASALRQTLAVTHAHLAAAGASLDDLAAVPQRRQPPHATFPVTARTEPLPASPAP